MKIIEHPNGFLRVKLENDDVLHIWDKPGEIDTDIHQHSYSFHSEILTGVMQENLYNYLPDPDGEWERWTITCGVKEDGIYHVEEHGERVRVTPFLIHAVTRKAGDSYYRPHADFHTVTALETPLITRVRKDVIADPEHYFLRHR